MVEVEKLMQSDLKCCDPLLVKNGLSNVLYWGYAQIGYRDRRVKRFRDKVSNHQLKATVLLFRQMEDDGLKQIKSLALPEFSGMSFISKIRMFLDPKNHVVLDQQILKMNSAQVPTILREISFGGNDTQIRITQRNVEVYRAWCKKCVEISGRYFSSVYNAVDVERGFFTLIQEQQIELVASILSRA